MADVSHKRGDLADFLTLAGGSGLVVGQHYNLEDIGSVAVALTASTYYILPSFNLASYSHGGSQSIDFTEATMTIATTNEEDSDYALASNEVTVGVAHRRKHTISISTEDTDEAGAARCYVRGAVQYKPSGGSFADVAGSEFMLYHRETQNAGRSHVFTHTNAVDGVYRLRLDRIGGGTNINLTADCNWIIERC